MNVKQLEDDESLGLTLHLQKKKWNVVDAGGNQKQIETETNAGDAKEKEMEISADDDEEGNTEMKLHAVDATCMRKKASELIMDRVFSKLYDFDNHLSNVELDWIENSDLHF